MSVLHNRAEGLLDAGKFIQVRAAFVALHVEDLPASRFGLGRVCLAQASGNREPDRVERIDSRYSAHWQLAAAVHK